MSLNIRSCMFGYNLSHCWYRLKLELGGPRNTCVTCPGIFRNLTKGNYSKNINARLMDPLHDTSSHQGLSIYEVSYKKYKQNLSYYKIKKCDRKSVRDRSDRQTDRRQTDRRTDGRTDGRMDGLTDGRTDRHRDRQTAEK